MKSAELLAPGAHVRPTTPEDERKSESKHAGLEIPDGSEEKASAEHCFSKTVAGSL